MDFMRQSALHISYRTNTMRKQLVCQIVYRDRSRMKLILKVEDEHFEIKSPHVSFIYESEDSRVFYTCPIEHFNDIFLEMFESKDIVKIFIYRIKINFLIVGELPELSEKETYSFLGKLLNPTIKLNNIREITLFDAIYDYEIELKKTKSKLAKKMSLVKRQIIQIRQTRQRPDVKKKWEPPESYEKSVINSYCEFAKSNEEWSLYSV
jgi:hypothetical protein